MAAEVFEPKPRPSQEGGRRQQPEVNAGEDGGKKTADQAHVVVQRQPRHQVVDELVGGFAVRRADAVVDGEDVVDERPVADGDGARQAGRAAGELEEGDVVRARRGFGNGRRGGGAQGFRVERAGGERGQLWVFATGQTFAQADSGDDQAGVQTFGDARHLEGLRIAAAHAGRRGHGDR